MFYVKLAPHDCKHDVSGVQVLHPHVHFLEYTNNTAVMVDPLVNSVSTFIFALKGKGGGRFARKLWFSLYIHFYFVLVFLQNMRKLETLANGSVLRISLSQHVITTGFQGREELLLGGIPRWCIMCYGLELKPIPCTLISGDRGWSRSINEPIMQRSRIPVF